VIHPDTHESTRLRRWRELQYGMFLHFGMSTFTGDELDPGDVLSTVYAPSDPDPRQWMRVARKAGMRYAILTAKHVSGHCLWDSRVVYRGREYDYDVATSGNPTDVVRVFLDACREFGIVPGLYYCLLDFRNNPVERGKQWTCQELPEEYFAFVQAQLAELAANYPEVRIFWIDIPRAASAAQRAVLYDQLRRADPERVVMFNYGFIDKNATGPFDLATTGGLSWPTDVLNSERDVIPVPASPVQEWNGGTYHLGYEHCDVVGQNWFWTEGDAARPPDTLLGLYHDTVRVAGGNLLLNVGPNRAGRLEEWQIDALLELGRRIAAPSAEGR
jgi:alpha-L-fucosidase